MLLPMAMVVTAQRNEMGNDRKEWIFILFFGFGLVFPLFIVDFHFPS